MSCPGYSKVYRFRDEAPALKQRYNTISQEHDEGSSSSSALALREPPHRAHRNTKYQPLPLPIDQNVSPSLAVQALASQQTQIFANFVMTAFPCIFKSTETRVSLNWVEFVGNRQVEPSPSRSPSPSSPRTTPSAEPDCFDWALRCITCIYTGHLFNDQRFIDASRVLYSKALRGLGGQLSDESRAKSDLPLATAIMLSVYEMHACTTPDSWLRHCAGVAELMCLRGPEAHLHGFGRSTYIAVRPFLVTAALVTGQACFLERPEWQAMAAEIAADNARQPDSSLFTDITERAFMEITKCPGYVKRMRELLAVPDDHRNKKRRAELRQSLLQSILGTRAALRGLHTEFGVAIATHNAGKDQNRDEDRDYDRKFVGPLPYVFFDGFSTLSIKGIRSAIILLNHLIYILNPDERPAIEAENRALSNAIGETAPAGGPKGGKHEGMQSPLTPPRSPERIGTGTGTMRLLCQSLITPETKEPPTGNWMDRISTTMGLDGVRVTLVEDE